MTIYPAAFQKGLDAYYENLNLAELRHFFDLQGAQQIADFEAGYVCAASDDEI